MEMTLPTRDELEQLYHEIIELHETALQLEARYRYLHDRADDEPWLDYDANLIEQTAHSLQSAFYPIERILQDKKTYPFHSPLLNQ